MTPQEAKELVKQCGLNVNSTLHEDCLKIIISALEKQIPKKPIIDPANLCDFQDFLCPKCNHKIIARIDGEWIAGKLQNYCENCGQALDWSDTK